MAVWSTRTSGYKLGVGVLFLGSLFYLIGFATPFWSDVKYQDMRVYSGLWTSCVASDVLKTCESISDEPSWFKAVQALETLGLMGAMGVCVYAVVTNARQTPLPYNYGVLVVLSAFSGVSGFIGYIIFASEVTGGKDTAENYIGWSVGLNVAGCILFLLIAAPIIFISSRADLASPATRRGAFVVSGAGVPVAVTMQQGGVYPPPGQGYAPPGQGYPLPPVAQPVYGYDQGYSASAAPV